MVQRLLGHNLSWRYCQTWVTFVHNLKVFLFSFFVLGAQDSCYKGIEVCYNLSIDRRIDHCAILNWMNLLGHRSLQPVMLRGIAQSKIKNCLCVQLQKYQEKLRFRCRKDSKTRAEQIYLDDCSKVLASLDLLEMFSFKGPTTFSIHFHLSLVRNFLSCINLHMYKASLLYCQKGKLSYYSLIK